MARTGISVAAAVGVPRLWPDETAVAIASGPSLTPADVDYCRGKARVLVINRSLLLAPWADAFHASDARIARWLPEETQAFQGLTFTMTRDAFHDYGALVLKNGGIWGLSTDPTTICNGRNSGYQALNILALLGVTRIVLLGYDMQAGPQGELHWHGDHPENRNPGPLQFRSWCGAFKSIVAPLAALGITVINCSRRTALDVFPCAPLEATL